MGWLGGMWDVGKGDKRGSRMWGRLGGGGRVE